MVQRNGYRHRDLDTRVGKHPGGYCTRFAWSRQPFIFMNASGVNYDVSTLLHEAGHCLHVYESRDLPFFHQHHAGEEISEVAKYVNGMEYIVARNAVNDTNFFEWDQKTYKKYFSRLNSAHSSTVSGLALPVATSALSMWP